MQSYNVGRHLFEKNTKENKTIYLFVYSFSSPSEISRLIPRRTPHLQCTQQICFLIFFPVKQGGYQSILLPREVNSILFDLDKG